MKTLEEIKDEYAVLYCQYPSWEDFINDIPNHEVEEHMDEVAKLYATQYGKRALKNASDNADTIEVDNGYGMIDVVDKQSILSEDNLPKH